MERLHVREQGEEVVALEVKIGRKVRVVKELGLYHGEKSRREF